MPEGGYHGAYVDELAEEIAGRGRRPVAGRARRRSAWRSSGRRGSGACSTTSGRCWRGSASSSTCGSRSGRLHESRRRRRGDRARCGSAGYVYEQDGALWLRTTALGDDKDRVVVRATGEPTYLAPDVGLRAATSSAAGSIASSTCGAPITTATSRRLRAVVQALGFDPDVRRVRDRAVREPVPRRRAGPDVQADRRAGHVRRAPGRGGRRRRALPVRAPAGRHADRLRHRGGHAARRWTTPSTTCSTPTPGSPACSGWPTERGVDGGSVRGRRPAPGWSTPPSSTCCGRSRSTPRWSRWPRDHRAPHRVARYAEERWPWRSIASTPTARSSAPRTPAWPGPGCGSPRAPGRSWPTRSALLGVSAPEAMARLAGRRRRRA